MAALDTLGDLLAEALRLAGDLLTGDLLAARLGDLLFLAGDLRLFGDAALPCETCLRQANNFCVETTLLFDIGLLFILL